MFCRSVAHLKNHSCWTKDILRHTFSTTTRDVRLAGRRRFYKEVGVTNTYPPWHHQQQDGKAVSIIPGGAGVDGSDSANGISLDKPNIETLREMLDPLFFPKGNKDKIHDPAMPSSSSSSSSSSSWYTVTLDSRPLLTPLKTPMSVPSLPLAILIATEWSNQTKYLQPTQMPITTLCCTALDQMTIPSIRQTAMDKLLRYLQTDSTCFFTDPKEDRILYRKQKQAWENVHEWISTDDTSGLLSYASKIDNDSTIKKNGQSPPLLATTTGFGIITTKNNNTASSNSMMGGLPHSPQAYKLAKVFLESLDAWRFTAMQAVTMEAKSFIIGMALISASMHHHPTNLSSSSSSSSSSSTKYKNPFADDLKKAVMASRIEEECQIENWGLVEGQHDYDRLNASIQIHSAVLLSNCVNTILLSK